MAIRWRGAIAGLVPAAILLMLVVLAGGFAPRPEAMVAIAGLVAASMAIGWVAAPAATGGARGDLRAGLAFALVAGVLYVVVAAVNGAVTDVAGAAGLSDRLTRLVGSAAYGFVYLPLLMAFASPLAVAWTVAVRVLRRGRASEAADGLPATPGRTGTTGGPRRMALLGAAVVVIYSVFVAVLPLTLADEPRPPWWLQRPLALFILFTVPAVVAGLGAWRGLRPLIAAAGILCLLQGSVAFSGVTIGFAIPGLVLLAAAASRDWPPGRPASPIPAAAAGAVFALTISAWVSLFALTEPRCWAFGTRPDGTVSSVEIPVDGRITITNGGSFGSGTVSGDGPGSGDGCSSGEITDKGLAVSSLLIAGSVAIAAAATRTARGVESA